MKHTNTINGQKCSTVKEGGICNAHCNLRGGNMIVSKAKECFVLDATRNIAIATCDMSAFLCFPQANMANDLQGSLYYLFWFQV